MPKMKKTNVREALVKELTERKKKARNEHKALETTDLFNCRAELDTLKETDEYWEFTMSLTSSMPVERGFWYKYYEVLDLRSSKLNLGRLKSGDSPLLKDHRNSTDTTVGTIVKAWIKKGSGNEGDDDEYDKLMGKVRFYKTRERSEEMFKDIETGLVRNVSVGYDTIGLDKEALEIIDEDEDGNELKIPTVIFKSYQFFEASMVAVPADHTVGVGRNIDNSKSNLGGSDMPKKADKNKEKELETEVEVEESETPEKETEELETKSQEDTGTGETKTVADEDNGDDKKSAFKFKSEQPQTCLLYTSPSPRD